MTCSETRSTITPAPCSLQCRGSIPNGRPRDAGTGCSGAARPTTPHYECHRPPITAAAKGRGIHELRSITHMQHRFPGLLVREPTLAVAWTEAHRQDRAGGREGNGPLPTTGRGRDHWPRQRHGGQAALGPRAHTFHPSLPPLQHHQGEPVAVSTASREPSTLAAPVRTRARTALRPLAPGDAHISGGFWRTRQDRHRVDALAAGYEQLETSGTDRKSVAEGK